MFGIIMMDIIIVAMKVAAIGNTKKSYQSTGQ